MAKRQIVACIFCGELPCVCDAKTSTKSSKRQSTAPKLSDSTPTASILSEPSTSDDWMLSTGDTTPKFHAETKTPTQDELIMREAIRNLEPLMSPQTKMQYKDVLDPPQGVELFRKGVQVRDYYR